MSNLFDPAILFFVFGVLAGTVKSNLEIPPQISRFLSLYLLMALGLKGGQLVANPIPVEAEILKDQIMPVIEQALSEAAAQGIAAKAVTPFLLSRIFELTQGRSLESNIELVLNNARLAARIAAAMA